MPQGNGRKSLSAACSPWFLCWQKILALKHVVKKGTAHLGGHTVKPGTLDLEDSYSKHGAKDMALSSYQRYRPAGKDGWEAKSSTQGQKHFPLTARKQVRQQGGEKVIAVTFPEQDRKLNFFRSLNRASAGSKILWQPLESPSAWVNRNSTEIHHYLWDDVIFQCLRGLGWA